MRIVHVFDHSLPLHSGYTFRSRALLEGQRALGWHTAHVTAPKHSADGPPDEQVDGLLFHRSARPGGLAARVPVAREAAEIAATARRLDAVARDVRPDVIQAHSPVLNAIAAHRVARAHGLPWVYEVRAFWEDAAVAHGTARAGGPRYRLSRAAESWALKRATGVTTICEGLRRDIVARGIAADRVAVVANAVDADHFQPLEPDPALARELGLDGRVVLGFLGSFYDYEGLDLLLDALPLLRRRRPEAALLLVGGGPEDERLRAQAARLGLDDHVVFTGRVPHDVVARYYALVDLLVFPRKSMRLTELVTPLKPLEAMAQRKLVLASRVGGHKELVQDGETGWLFDPDDPAALADAVDRALEQRDQWPRILDAGRAYVERERTWAHSVAAYPELFRRIGIAGSG